jgi:hypothetical protein
MISLIGFGFINSLMYLTVKSFQLICIPSPKELARQARQKLTRQEPQKCETFHAKNPHPSSS